MLETLAVAFGVTLIAAFLVGTGIVVAVAVTVLRQFNRTNQEMTDDFDKGEENF